MDSISKEISEAYSSMVNFEVDDDSISVINNGEKIGYINFDITYIEDLLDSFEDMNLGFDSSSIPNSISPLEQIAYVELLYINRDFRMKNIATSLMKKFIDEMHNRCIFQILLRAEPDEDSIPVENLVNFYKKFNFKEIDRTDNGGVLMLKI